MIIFHGMLRVSLQLCALAIINSALAFGSVQKIGPDLYAYISSNDSSSNSVFLIGENGILVVDTGLNDLEGRMLLREIRGISQLPVRWVVNTHYHPDHRGGNFAIAPDAVVISSLSTRQQVLHDGKKQVIDYSLNETVGQEGLSLYVGKHEARIYGAGPAHTRGDLVVYFPDQHAIATGDLFLNNSCPYMDDGDLENWVVALDSMLTLPIEHVVPGHFEVAGWIELQRFRDYLEELRNQVSQMHAAGLPLKEVQQKLDMRAYQGMRQFPKFEATFADNAAAYYRQLDRRALKTKN